MDLSASSLTRLNDEFGDEQVAQAKDRQLRLADQGMAQLLGPGQRCRCCLVLAVLFAWELNWKVDKYL